MGAALASWGLNLAGQAAGMGMGMIGAKWQDKRQLKQQEKLQRLEIQGQKEMSDYQYGLEMRKWNETNYDAQMKQLEKAGLNAGLLYGMQGGGGATAQTAGGDVTGAHAPSGGGEMMQGGAMGMQLGMMAAQKALIEAQTEKTQVETQKTAGVDTKEAETRIASLAQGIKNAKAQKDLTELQASIAEVELEIKGATQNAAKALVMQELRSSYERMEMIKNEAKISDATMDEKIKIVEQELIGAYARNELTRTQTEATKQGTVQSKATVDQMAKTIALEYSKLKNETDKTAISKRLVDFETSFGKQASNILNSILGSVRGR